MLEARTHGSGLSCFARDAQFLSNVLIVLGGVRSIIKGCKICGLPRAVWGDMKPSRFEVARSGVELGESSGRQSPLETDALVQARA